MNCVTAVWKIALYTSAFLWACLFSAAKFSIFENWVIAVKWWKSYIKYWLFDLVLYDTTVGVLTIRSSLLVQGIGSCSTHVGTWAFLVNTRHVLCRRSTVDLINFIPCLKSVCAFGGHVNKDKQSLWRSTKFNFTN